MIRFKGYRIDTDYASGTVVLVSADGERWANLPLYLNHVNHSPTGFNWGYYGSGPAQLAFAILFKYYCSVSDLTPDEIKDKIDGGLYQSFKNDFVGKWGGQWEIDGDIIKKWLEEKANEN